MATTLCPNCGTARMGSFRYCRTCGLDYDSPTSSTAKAPPAILSSLPDEPTSEVTAPLVAGGGPPPAAAGDVIVIRIAHLKMVLGLLVGGLIGAMLAGAVVVPFLGHDRLLLGSLAAIATTVVAAGLGLRFAQVSPPTSGGRGRRRQDELTIRR